MSSLNGVALPGKLGLPMLVGGRVAAKVMLDLTAYLIGPDAEELDAIFDAYWATCPADRQLKYRTTELEYWPHLSRPDLTESGRDAAMRKVRWPFLEPVRHRIEAGRAFDAQLWDGMSIDDPRGSWSLSVRAIKSRASGVHSFVRVLMPVDTDPQRLWMLATKIAQVARLHSGHAGLSFVYDPWMKEQVFDLIYALARRFWNIDIEDINATLPLMRRHIKGVSWITMIGHELAAISKLTMSDVLKTADFGVLLESAAKAMLARVGLAPDVGDVSRPETLMHGYRALSSALESLHLDDHPNFPGSRFAENENTIGWLRRQLNPGDWRN